MGQKSTVRKLPPEILKAVEDLIAGGRATIEEITAHIRALGGDVSRSAVGRFKRHHEQALAHFREVNEVAGIWMKKANENPDSDVGRLLQEMLKTIVFQSLADKETLDPRDVMFMGKALKDLAGAQKLSTDLIERALAKRQAQLETQAAAAAKEIANIAKPAGLSDDTIAKIHAALKGAIA